METIKSLEDLSKPDPRSSLWEMVNKKTGLRRPIQIEDHYRRFTRDAVNPSVPEDVRNLLVVAANLYVYAWFVYSFGAVAELQCLAALEMALRRRAGIGDGKPGPGLRKLMHRAIAEGWIRDSGLPRPALLPGFQLDSGAGSSDPQARVKHMANSLPNWRNIIAHGAYMTFPPGNVLLGVVTGLVNQLWPTIYGGV